MLSYSYELDNAGLIEVLDRILLAYVFEFGNRSVVAGALNHFRKGRANFADYIIGEVAARAGCARVITFENRLKSSTGFAVL